MTNKRTEYEKNNTRFFGIKLNYNTDANLISLLESQDNIQGFIKKVLDDYIKAFPDGGVAPVTEGGVL